MHHHIQNNQIFSQMVDLKPPIKIKNLKLNQSSHQKKKWFLKIINLIQVKILANIRCYRKKNLHPCQIIKKDLVLTINNQTRKNQLKLVKILVNQNHKEVCSIKAILIIIFNLNNQLLNQKKVLFPNILSFQKNNHMNTSMTMQ